MVEISENMRFYAAVFVFALGILAFDDFRDIVRTGYDGGDGHEITLQNNKSAIDPTYAQVKDFILEDRTNYKKYSSEFLCGDFSEEFHNNAETKGLKCGWVFVDLENDSDDHACNVFNTTDEGLVFVDCTNGDAFVKLEEGKEYQSKYFESMGIVSYYHIYW